jgi:hypothetical protein
VLSTLESLYVCFPSLLLLVSTFVSLLVDFILDVKNLTMCELLHHLLTTFLDIHEILDSVK